MPQMKAYGVIPRSIVTGIILPLIVASSFGQSGSRNIVRQIKFEPEHTSAVLRALLRPYTSHIYRFHGREGQRIHVNLHVVTKKAEEQDDIVFWAQSRDYIPGRNTLLLEGIDKGGVTKWSGELPVSGEYEIYISNPKISDHAVTRSLRYTLEVTIQ